MAQAQPLAQGLLADPSAHLNADGLLPVYPLVVPAAGARYGYLLPAWPELDKRPVPIYAVPSFGLMAYLWRQGIGEAADERAAVDERFLSGERLWVGLANDVLQPFVPDPPPGTYRMYRHHALMLFTATTWLPTAQRDGWLALYGRGARTAIARYGLAALDDPIPWMDERDLQATSFYEEYGPTVRDDASIRRFLQDRDGLARYAGFAALSTIGIAALAAAHAQLPEDQRHGWLRAQVNEEHRRPDFLEATIRAFLRAHA